MTLKEGRQKEYFLHVLKQHYPELITEYQKIYQSNQWGQATDQYNASIHQTFLRVAKKYKLPIRMPLHLFDKILDENTFVEVMLGHIDRKLFWKFWIRRNLLIWNNYIHENPILEDH